MIVNNQLPAEKIDRLFEFVKSKNVPFVDVQYEIVDHLASAIEASMEADKSMDFEKTLTDIYGQFPITGFAQLQIQKEEMLKHYWWTRIIEYLKLYFIPPRIILTILLTALMYFIFSIGNNLSFIIISWAFIILGIIAQRFSYKDTKLEIYKYLVFKSYYSSVTKILIAAFAIPALIVYQPQFFMEINLKPIYLFCAFYYALSIIVSYAVFWIFPRMMFVEINTKYRHLKVA